MHPPINDSSTIARESLDEVCQEIRRALAPTLVHAVSLYDQAGGLLWMTSSVLNDDVAVRAAFVRFNAAPSTMLCVSSLGHAPGHHAEPRSGVVFRVADSRGRPVGAAMAVLSTAALPREPAAAANLLSEPLRRVLSNFARLRSGAEPEGDASAAVLGVSGRSATRMPATEPAPANAAATNPAPANAAPSHPAPVNAAASPPLSRTSIIAPYASQSITVTKASPAAKRPAPASGHSAPSAGNSVAAPPAKTRSTVISAPLEGVLPVPIAATAKIAPMVPTADRAPLLPIADSVPRPSNAKNAALLPITQKAPAAAIIRSEGPASPVKNAPVAHRPPAQAAGGNALHEAVMRSTLALYVQRFVPLDKSSRQKRYELLWEFQGAASARSLAELKKSSPEEEPSSIIARRVFAELLAWLKQHPQVGQDRNLTLTVKLSRSALHDPDFVPFVARSLQKSGVPKGMIGFEIPAVTPRKSVAAITKLALLLRQTGCFLTLDNFSLRTEAFNALHLPGVALIKLSHEVTVKMHRDKLARAGISAMTQMARVLGVQVVAKRTKLAADLVRLTTFGVDFVQSESIAPALPIATLAHRRSPGTLAAVGATPMPSTKSRA